MSKPVARLATACPMRPNPMIPSVAPAKSAPSSMDGPQVFHFPARRNFSASTTRRPAAIISAKAMSAVASVRMPGVLPTGMPRSVAAATSMLSNPTAWLLMTFSPGPAASITSAIDAVGQQAQQAVHAAHALQQGSRGLAAVHPARYRPGRILLTRSSPLSRMIRVTNTFGFAMPEVYCKRGRRPIFHPQQCAIRAWRASWRLHWML